MTDPLTPTPPAAQDAADQPLRRVPSYRTLARLAVGVVAVLGVGAASCAFVDQSSTVVTRPVADVELVVADESGTPVVGASVTLPLDADGDGVDDVETTGSDGNVTLTLDGPVVAVVSAPGALDEPVAVAPSDVSVDVTLWNRVSADGKERQTLHFGGDVMLGRRYLDERSATTPVIDEATARAVVDDLAPLSATADFTVVNLETAIGNLPDDEALVAKRFLLQSTPHVTDMLDEMGVDLVTLGNNHAYDWGEQGLDNTLQALDEAGMAHVGAGSSTEESIRGRIDSVGTLDVGTVSVTTVNGSFVNDQLPDAEEARPVDLPASEAWQYELRRFGFDTGDTDTTIPVADRRIGVVWQLFEHAEETLDTASLAELWAEMTAIYPELQDWVARRGHGGAAPYDRKAVHAEIERLRMAGADLVVVQIHGGYQFAEVASGFVTRISRRAIDAGADMVIAHHPHVLQGVEWYDGKLIAHSLGNLVFDQNFLATFPSMILRVVTQGPDVLEVRVLPVMLDRYRPVPLVGEAAQRVVMTIASRSALAATSGRVDGLDVGSMLDADAVHASTSAVLHFERNSGVVGMGRVAEQHEVLLDADGLAELPICALVRVDRLPSGMEYGVDIFEWGSFDNFTADDRFLLPLNWKVPVDRSNWTKTSGVSGTAFDDALEFRTDPNSTTIAQIAGRVDVPEHRLFDEDGRAVDGAATYQVRLDARRNRGETPSIRMSSFAFDDTDPTADPETERINGVEMDVAVPGDEVWRSVLLDVPDTLFDRAADTPGVDPANTATLIISAPPALGGRFAVDNLEIIEWRPALTTNVPVWRHVDWVRGAPDAAVPLQISGC